MFFGMSSTHVSRETGFEQYTWTLINADLGNGINYQIDIDLISLNNYIICL